MTTPSNTPPAGDKSPSLSKFIRRASRVLRPRSTASVDLGQPARESRTVSTASKLPMVATTSTRAAQPVAMTAPTVPTAPNALPSVAMPEPPASGSAQYFKAQEDKARALFAKYGMTLSSEEWTSPANSQAQWVEKKIVMRVHRQCHRCQTIFGKEKLCTQCQHTRCKKCPRYPAVKVTTAEQPTYDTSYSVLVDPLHETRLSMGGARSLTLQTKTGKEAVRKQPTQRVRRTCHKCQTMFTGKATVCEICTHPRCPQCPRDPPKTSKWPNGYPGDVAERFPLAERVRKPIRQRFRWECHSCQKVFIEHEKTCAGCGHDRCDDCPRKPPKKVKKEVPDDLIQSVETKIQALSLEVSREGDSTKAN